MLLGAVKMGSTGMENVSLSMAYDWRAKIACDDGFGPDEHGMESKEARKLCEV